MRKIVVNNIVSLDGFYADSTGNPLVLNMDGAFDESNLDSINAASTVLLGRESFDGFSAYWPFIADAPAADGPDARRFSQVNRAISRRYNILPKVVVSDGGPIASDNPWVQTTTLLPRGQALDWLRDAKLSSGEDILIFASRRTWNWLLGHDLIDELHLLVSPVSLGTGVRLFDAPVDLELLESRRYDRSSNVQLRYRVCRRWP
ncbi:dihydrofolate reductase family protein [Microbacterium soli]|uniref:Dihydrofolate reductase family protein n=1 Tax=Microbacterium soli TaxID=446075 RepID=A0ABP7NF03_9MICO